MSIPASQLVPLVVSENVQVTKTTETIGTVSNISTLTFAALSIASTLQWDVSLRIPDAFGNGGNYNMYLIPKIATINVNVIFPIGLSTITPSQGQTPLRPITDFDLGAAGSVTKLTFPPGSEPTAGTLVALQFFNVTIPASGSIFEIVLSKKSLEISDILQSPLTCPLTMGSGESFTQTATGCELSLNRNLTVNSELGIVQIFAKLLYTSGNYTVTSNKTSLIGNSSGVISANSNFVVFVSPLQSTTTPIPITLTIQINGLGNEAFINLTPTL